MTEEYYKEISIESINPDLFPDVAVYLKSGANYMLYKPHGRKLTADDHERLQRRASEYVYVRTGDMEEVSAYQEQNLASLLQRTNLKSPAKGKIFFQVCVDYVAEVFDSPHKVKDEARVRNLIRQMVWLVAHDRDALEALKTVAAETPYRIIHGVQVAALTLLMHTRIFPTVRDVMLEDVGIGALFLDLGMALGDAGHTGAHGSPSHHEYQVMKQHATTGYEFLKRTGIFSDIALAVVHHHHERHDGKGYPSHLIGDAIPKSVQLAALCDSFSAMTSDRGYRKAVTTAEALQTMKGLKGAHEPALFQSFEKIIREIRY